MIRLRDSSSVSDTSSKRYIITAPPSDFILLPSDMVSLKLLYSGGTQLILNLSGFCADAVRPRDRVSTTGGRYKLIITRILARVCVHHMSQSRGILFIIDTAIITHSTPKQSQDPHLRESHSFIHYTLQFYRVPIKKLTLHECIQRIK